MSVEELAAAIRGTFNTTLGQALAAIKTGALKVLFGATRLISINELESCPVQPEVRTDTPALVGLMLRIMKTGFIVPIIVVQTGKKSFIVVDGHRRLAIAKYLGFTEITAIVMPEGTDARSGFIALNAANRTFSGPEWFKVWALATNRMSILNDFPKAMKKHIKDIESWVGTSRALALANTGYSPAIAGTVNRIMKLQRQYADVLQKKSLKKQSETQILEWLITNEAQAAAGAIARNLKRELHPDKIVSALFKDIQANVHPTTHRPVAEVA